MKVEDLNGCTVLLCDVDPKLFMPYNFVLQPQKDRVCYSVIISVIYIPLTNNGAPVRSCFR